MSLAVFLTVSLGFAALALATRSRASLSTVIGLAGLAASTIAAQALNPAELVTIGQAGLATSAYVRLFLILGSLVGLGLGVTGLATGTRRW